MALGYMKADIIMCNVLLEHTNHWDMLLVVLVKVSFVALGYMKPYIIMCNVLLEHTNH